MSAAHFLQDDCEGEDPFLTIYGEMDDDSFHRMYFSMMNGTIRMASIETCDVMGEYSRHGCESLGTGIQSAREADISGESSLVEKSSFD